MPREVRLARYHREVRQRRQAAPAPRVEGDPQTPESRSERQPMGESSIPPSNSEPVPSEPPPAGGPEQYVESPAAAVARLERERILASQVLAYAGPQERERVLNEEWFTRSMSWEWL